jgi:hypothetical protein
MKLSKHLRKEWALIDHPKKWCKRHSALNSKGRIVYELDDAACRFCQGGARNKVDSEGTKFFGDSCWLANDVAKLFNFDSAVELNDDPKTTHNDMRVFYEVMIYMAEQCEQ